MKRFVDLLAVAGRSADHGNGHAEHPVARALSLGQVTLAFYILDHCAPGSLAQDPLVYSIFEKRYFLVFWFFFGYFFD